MLLVAGPLLRDRKSSLLPLLFSMSQTGKNEKAVLILIFNG